MRRYGLYDATRGLMTALAVGLAGLLLWAAAQVGQQSTARFWAEMAVVAGAGLVLALLPALGGWTAGLRLRFSPGVFALGFLPTLVVAGWILLATQPGNGWHEGRFVSWSHDLGVMGVVHAIGLWHGVLALGIGAALGMSLDAVPVAAPAEDVVVDRRTPAAERTAVVPAGGQPARRSWWRRRRGEDRAADEPITAERTAQADAGTAAEPVGPTRRDRVTTVE